MSDKPELKCESGLALAVEAALETYFLGLKGQSPTQLYPMVIKEVEEPLFKMVMKRADGNQSKAAKMLGINRNTLRSKLEAHGLISS